MKKKYIVFILIFLTLSLWAGKFYWQNLRGIGPVINPVKENITDILSTVDNPLNLPDGFSIQIFAKNLNNPRVIIFDTDKNILVSVPSDGKVLLIGKDYQKVLVDGLNRPHGLAFYCKLDCKLYIAETNSVSVYDYDKEKLAISNKKKLFDLPAGGNHFSRTLLIAKIEGEDKLLISVGSDCNVCNEKDWRRAKILSANLDGSDLKVFSSGLRNSVFMAINPVSMKIFATEMARDLLGDDIPPDEINIIEEGKNYGWPICYGKNIHDTSFDKNTYIRNPCMEPFETPSYIDIPAHSAPLGLAFTPRTINWPEEYKNNLFVAYHGSWNRSVPTGYKIVRHKFDQNGNISTKSSEDFISGWLKTDNTTSGRPVDILFDENLGMFVSDDKAGVIYLVTYKK